MTKDLKFLFSGVALVLLAPMPALAGAAVPAPLAALAGPYGLVAAGLVYGGFRVVRHLRNKP